MQKSDNWPEHTIPARTQTFAEVTLPLTSTMSNLRPCLTSVPSVELASYCLGRSQHLFHSGIVSAPRTLFECLLTLSLPASWHWPRVCGIARHCVTRTACVFPCNATAVECCTVSFAMLWFHTAAAGCGDPVLTLAIVLTMEPRLTTKFLNLSLQ